MNNSEIMKRDGDCNNYCIGGTIYGGNTELQAVCETHFSSKCILQAPNSLIFYIVIAFIGGLIVAAIAFRVRRRCQLIRNKKKVENEGTCDVGARLSSKCPCQLPQTDCCRTKIPTYIWWYSILLKVSILVFFLSGRFWRINTWKIKK